MKESYAININIKTHRLILRNMTVEDISQDYADWLNDPDVNKYLRRTNTTQTIQSCIEYVQSYTVRNDTALIGIFLKEDERHIGNLTLSSIDWLNQTVTVGISIGRKDLWGQGLAKEALSTLMEYCFKELETHHIQAGIRTQNSRSVNLFMKCNFRTKNPLQDFDRHTFSISREEYFAIAK